MESLPPHLAPGRLWSLWDIMRTFHAGNFVQLTASLHDLSVATPSDKKAISEKTKDQGKNAFVGWDKTTADLGLSASRATIRKIIECFAKDGCTYEDLRDPCKELVGRLIDELTVRTCFSLSLRESDYYEKPFASWESAIIRFPAIASDVEEASKCFALSRYAAAVFHSVQVFEACLIELGAFLKVTDPKSGWTAIAASLNKVLRKDHRDRTRFEKQNFVFLEQMQGTVEGLKNAWRNKISHVHGKLTLMTTDFSPEVAEEILFATRAFARRLAEGLPPPKEQKKGVIRPSFLD